MKPYQRFLVVATGSALAAAGWRGFQIWKERAIEAAKAQGRDAPPPARSIVVEQLKEHRQDETPFVRAFETALEREGMLEKQFAQENGLKH
jgi:hypothetical protein